MKQRPLSPHLQIYKWQLTSVLSILHRMTGVALSVGLVMLALWVTSAAFWPDLFEILHRIFSSIFGKIALFGWSWAAFYHAGNGVRHLVWDAGHGYSLKAVYRGGTIVIVASFLATLGAWWWASCPAQPGCMKAWRGTSSSAPAAPTTEIPDANLPDTVLPRIPQGARP